MAGTRFMKSVSGEVINSLIALCSKSRTRPTEGVVKSYCEAVNYLFDTYSTDDLVAETDADMMHSTQSPKKSCTEYVEALWIKAL